MATAPVTIPCPICAEPLRFTVCTNRNGKHSIGVHCPQDGRHFRGFINHKPFVEDAISHMAAAEALAPTRPPGLRKPAVATKCSGDTGQCPPASGDMESRQ